MHHHISYQCAKRHLEILQDNEMAAFLGREQILTILLQIQNSFYLFSCQKEIPDCKTVQQHAKHALWSLSFYSFSLASS